MANMSSAFGTYKFSFHKVENATPEIKLNWFNKLFNELGCGEYWTGFDIDEAKTQLEYDEICLSFSGCGRWNYQGNIDWFEKDEKLKDIMLEMVGLELTIDFKDHEIGCGFICECTAELNVSDKVIIFQNCLHEYDFCYEAWKELDIGDKNGYLEEIGLDCWDINDALKHWKKENIGTDAEFYEYMGISA